MNATMSLRVRSKERGVSSAVTLVAGAAGLVTDGVGTDAGAATAVAAGVDESGELLATLVVEVTQPPSDRAASTQATTEERFGVVGCVKRRASGWRTTT